MKEMSMQASLGLSGAGFSPIGYAASHASTGTGLSASLSFTGTFLATQASRLSTFLNLADEIGGSKCEN